VWLSPSCASKKESVVKSRGYQGIALAGASDLDFIVEHACEICGIRYLKDDAAIKAATSGSDELFLEKRTRPAAAFLQEVMKQGAGTGAGETPGFQGRAAALPSHIEDMYLMRA
jgi:hypothetical protein